MKKTLVLGNGYLGQEFKRRGYEVLDKSRFTYMVGELVSEKLDEYDFDILINCIGKSNTRWCEDKRNFHKLMESNTYLVKDLSGYCKDRGKQFVHISTGCLYHNTHGKKNESDFVEAHCLYTLSKWVGENYCDTTRDLIIRPRLYFSDVDSPNNLLCKLRMFKSFLNEFNSITSTTTIVKAVEALLQNKQTGVFNVANDGAYTIYEIAKTCGLKGFMITEQELHKSQNLFLVNNVLDLSKLKQFFQPADTLIEVQKSWLRLMDSNKC